MTSGDRAGVREVLHRVPGPAVCGGEGLVPRWGHYQSRRILRMIVYLPTWMVDFLW